jgi:hypothetical protein
MELDGPADPVSLQRIPALHALKLRNVTEDLRRARRHQNPDLGIYSEPFSRGSMTRPDSVQENACILHRGSLLHAVG